MQTGYKKENPDPHRPAQVAALDAERSQVLCVEFHQQEHRTDEHAILNNPLVLDANTL